MNLKDITKLLGDVLRVKDDDELLEAIDRKSLKEHSKNYSSILSNYTTYIEVTLRTKRKMKLFFFWLAFSVMVTSVISLIALTVFTLISSQKEDFNASNYIIPCATAITSFLTVFIVIPKIIAKYLFNNNEENIMQKIVESIQEYDKYIRIHLRDEPKNDNKVNKSNEH